MNSHNTTNGSDITRWLLIGGLVVVAFFGAFKFAQALMMSYEDYYDKELVALSVETSGPHPLHESVAPKSSVYHARMRFPCRWQRGLTGKTGVHAWFKIDPQRQRRRRVRQATSRRMDANAARSGSGAG